MAADVLRQTVLEQPLVSFGREVCGDLEAALGREWLVTNGLGGYASGTVAGVNTRRYHGVLVAALDPPVSRMVLVGGFIEWASSDGGWFPLSTHEYADGVIDPDGYRYLQGFRLEGAMPVWEFALAGAILERRTWMPHGANTTCVMYTLVRADSPVRLDISPLVTYRDFHSLVTGAGWRPGLETTGDGVTVLACDDSAPFHVRSRDARYVPGGEWYWNFRHRAEAERGFPAHSDLYTAGAFLAELGPGQSVTLVATAEEHAGLDGERLLAAERQRQASLLAAAPDPDPVVQQLTLAADQFIVERRRPAPPRPAIIAGYHWFNDWGRDTMIALPGLLLATGRAGEAAGILRSFGSLVRDGLLPNNFPDTGSEPAYNTADASLWFVLALRAYHEATDDRALLSELLPVARVIIDAYNRGTAFGIAADPADGLLRAGEPGVQVTWMDARVGGWVVTPRTGKPVEVNALWYNALRWLAEQLPAGDGDEVAQMASRVRDSFRARFLDPGRDHLADVVDGPEGDDLSLRPNQLLAISLPYPLLERAEAARVLRSVARELGAGLGLRSLAPSADGYRGHYEGDAARRDASYHQGTAWSWFAGLYAEADYAVHDDRARALALLAPFRHHLSDAGLGSVSEIFDGDAPHRPRGAIAQAWAVGEVLRALRRFGGKGSGDV